MPDEKKVKELQVKLQAIYQGLEEIGRESAALDMYASEYALAIATLRNMQELSGKEEVLLPIGGNTYVKASLIGKEKVMYHVGAGIYREISIEEAIRRLEQDVERIQARISELREKSLELSKEAEKIRKELGELLRGSGNV